MQVHVFMTQGWYAFTPDATGANLPADKGPWEEFKIINLVRGQTSKIAVNTDAALEAVAKDGIYIMPSRRP